MRTVWTSSSLKNKAKQFAEKKLRIGPIKTVVNVGVIHLLILVVLRLWVICQEDIYHPQNSDIYHPHDHLVTHLLLDVLHDHLIKHLLLPILNVLHEL